MQSRHVSLLMSGQDQILTIPHELALSGTEVLLRKEGHRLIVEPIPANSFLSLLTTLPDITANTREFERIPALSLDNWLL
ncbi:MAG: AbrB/MazE/SpoVT family DNA-binding domain-containing protein [Cyanobacteria bacterium RM1_2_2]|nr:AbrB/MazE/SpoVT family DNA-binding domain-containing protein [Cyanobacteria bacterium RM1_2_2]